MATLFEFQGFFIDAVVFCFFCFLKNPCHSVLVNFCFNVASLPYKDFFCVLVMVWSKEKYDCFLGDVRELKRDFVGVFEDEIDFAGVS